LVARATANTWYNLIAGLVVGAAVSPACALAGAGAADEPKLVAQLWGRSSRAHAAINSAIECQRRGDYEGAAPLFQEALARQEDLTPQEREELARFVRDNTQALQSRRDGAALVRQAKEALQQGRSADAANLVKKAAAMEQYLLAADKALYLQLSQQLRLRGPATRTTRVSPAQARTLVVQARAQFQQGNWEAAEAMAREAEQSGATFTPAEDSPRRILEDLEKAHKDRKALLIAARTALGRGDYDQAEVYAHEAEQINSSGMNMPWSDSPAKVLKDIQAVRGQRPTAPADTRANLKTDGVRTQTALPPANPEANPSRAGVVNAANTPKETSLPGNPADTEKARTLLRQGRAALAKGDLVQARRCADQARALRPNLHWTEDTPEKLLTDLASAQGAKSGPEAVVQKPSGPGAKTKEEAVALVKQGRQLLEEHKLDEATQCAQRARALTTARWGLFEDSPDALLADLAKLQATKGKDESAKVLTEARRLYERGDYAAAEREAYRAKTLHGPYSVWDLGDRPDKLLADIQSAREKNRKPALPPPVIVKGNGPKDAVSGLANDSPSAAKTRPDAGLARPGTDVASTPLQETRARQMLAEARQAVQLGDAVKAKLLADQVRDMHVTLNRPGDDSPEGIYRALSERSALRGSDGPMGGGGLAANLPPPGQMVDNAVKPASMPGTDARAAQAKAQYLMAEARQFLREDRLVEARQKLLEAQHCGAPLQTGEDGPDLISQQIAARARQKVDMLVSQAKETLRSGSGDPQVRLQKAEESLAQARQLAVTFGQDLQPVDQLLVWVRQQRNGGMLPPAGAEGRAVANASQPAQQASSHGMNLLNQARMELRNGDTAAARRFAEDACKPQYGVRDEAVAILRSIDTEEFNQRRLRAIRTFDAAWSAFVRADYAHSGNMIAAIDTRMLDEARQAKLRDMMATPEMQPSARGAVALTGGQSTSGAEGDLSVPAPGASKQAPPPTGSAQRNDPDKAILQRAAAMREVNFQKLRQEGLTVQSTAAEKFRSGQGDAAIEMLQDHIAFLNEQQLEPGQLTTLRRPIESRLQQFKLLRAQEEFATRGTRMHQAAQEKVAKGQLEQQNRQKQVADLMKQFNTLYREGKYTDAEAMAVRASELDPDNGIVSAAIHMARMHNNQSNYKKLKDAKESLVLNALNDTDDQGPYTNSLSINKDASERSRQRKSESSFTAPLHNEKEKEIERRLNAPVTLSFSDAPLKDVIRDIRAEQQMNIVVDELALQEAGISIDRPISVHLDNVSLKSVLNLLLRPLHLTHMIRDEVLLITTEDYAKGKLRRTVYNVADLVIPVENYSGDPAQMHSNPAIGNPLNPTPASMPSPVTGPLSLTNGAPVGQPTGGSMASGATPFASQQSSSGVPVVTTSKRQTTEAELIRLIQNNVEPKSWAEMGGPGTIDFFPHTLSLVVNQTPDIQDQIAELLGALRRLQDQEVAVEVRFITIAEDFFERIGVNFNLNFVNKHNGTSLQPALTSGQFTPDGFINAFTPKNFLTGLQPAGTFTPDLNIPLLTNTYTQAIPPFGGYNGIPGFGGVTMGLAFLSDIQVFLFMEAAQGDTRTNVMQAPKLTLFNGQTATLTVSDTQFFLTGVQVIPQQGIFTYNPTITPLNLGVNLTIQAVISADRRFVRMSLTPALTNLGSPNVALFPVVVPIFPLFDSTGTGQPIVFTQFIQQPSISAVTVSTTVAVPDGGTVLMGGLKRLSEGRNEYGPPVLSKIPFINRLFKNVGYGREAESLLIMVTPRIIIQAEEEERQTGVLPGPAGEP
jgi:type II secretory pathway component GspD/PulD (secretin)